MELILATILICVFLPFAVRRTITFSSAIIAFSLIFFPGDVWLAYYYGGWQLPLVDLTVIVTTYLAIACYLTGVLLAGAIANANTGSLKLFQMTGVISSQVIYIAALYVWILRIYGGVEYGIFFSGTDSPEAVLRLNYWFVVAYQLGQLFIHGIVLYLAFNFKKINKAGAFVLAAEFVWAFISGRREFLYMLILMILPYVPMLASPRYWKRFAIVGLVSVFFITVGSSVFLQARLYAENYQNSNGIEAAIYGMKRATHEILESRSSMDRGLRKNLAARPLMITQFVQSIAESQRAGFSALHGSALFTALRWSIPSALINKPHLPTEQFIQYENGQPLFDAGISVPAVGFADFGLLGCFIYGFTFVIIGNAILKIAKKLQRNALLGYAISAGLFLLAFNVEEDPLYIFVFIRNIIFIVAVYIAYRLLTPRIRRRDRRIDAALVLSRSDLPRKSWL